VNHENFSTSRDPRVVFFSWGLELIGLNYLPFAYWA